MAKLSLPLTAAERRALREAGLEPSDLAHMSGGALADITDDAIDERRGGELTALASLQTLPPVTPGVARVLRGLGVSGREDLASRSADQLYVDVARRLGGDHPSWHDTCSAAIACARGERDRELTDPRAWQRRRAATGWEPVELRWRDMHGATAALPAPLSAWIEVPSVRIRARLVRGGLDASGEPVTPLHSKQAVWLDGGDPSGRDLVIAHRVWSGGHGAFIELPRVGAGDAVTLEVDGTEHRYVAAAAREIAPDAPWRELCESELTLLTAAPIPGRPGRYVVGASSAR